MKKSFLFLVAMIFVSLGFSQSSLVDYTKMHDNVFIINSQIDVSSLKSKGGFSFVKKKMVVTDGQPYKDHVLTKVVGDGKAEIIVKSGRKGSTQVADFFRKNIKSNQNTFNNEPMLLNFAVLGDLTIDGKTFNDIMIAQGHNPFIGNNWWIGGKNCKYDATVSKGEITKSMECLATDGREYLISRGASRLGRWSMALQLIYMLGHVTYEQSEDLLNPTSIVETIKSYLDAGMAPSQAFISMTSIDYLIKNHDIPDGSYLNSCKDISYSEHYESHGGGFWGNVHLLSAKCMNDNGAYIENTDFAFRGGARAYLQPNCRGSSIVVNENGKLVCKQSVSDFDYGPYKIDASDGTIVNYRCNNQNCPTEIEIPNSVRDNDGSLIKIYSIGRNAFENNRLQAVKLPDTITSIGPEAFRGNQLKTITIPDSVGIIGKDAFIDEGGENNRLNKVTIVGGSAHFNSDWDQIFGTNDGGRKENPIAPIPSGITSIASCKKEFEDVVYETSIETCRYDLSQESTVSLDWTSIGPYCKGMLRCVYNNDDSFADLAYVKFPSGHPDKVAYAGHIYPDN
ncbi:leucine-rich repeat domain-containing protein [Francisella sp. 19X1-34]|uniref:leucine-rich repeat domain-containing protein n=1 Tax=Francisella sp. 19X1-34 TaxID=3087177 RepID=UPI002E3217AE|nr:leucine-rich repeat domain-containing protein [Francisella sp. 19X1-34]MED7789019.1 leucine-rich repeat domain-containing protein [Francisella sp. 19X1-34]